MSRIRMFVATVAAVGLAALARAQDTREHRPLTALVPEDMFLVARVGNISQVKQRFEEAGLASFWESEEFRGWMGRSGQGRSREGERSGRMFRFEGVKFEEFIEGEMIAAIAQPDPEQIRELFGGFGRMMNPFGEQPERAEAPSEPAGIFLAVAGNGQERLLEAIRREEAAAERLGARRTTETFRGVEITIWTLDADGDHPEERYAYVVVDGTTAAATDPELLRRVVRLATGGGERSLRDNERYGSVLNALGEGLVTVYINVEPLVREMIRSMGESGRDESLPGLGNVMRSLVDRSGVDRIEAVGFVFDVQGDRLAMRGYVHMPRGSAGFVRAVFAPDRNPGLPRFTTDDFEMVASSRMDWRLMYDTMVEILNPMLEQQGMTLEDVFSMMGIDPRADFIDNMNGDMVLLARGQGTGEDAALTPVQLIGLSNEEGFRSGWETFTAAAAGFGGERMFEEEEFEGTTFYKFSGQAMAIRSGYLISGAEDAVKQVVGRMAREGSSLRDREEFRSLLSSLPARRASETYMTREGFVRFWAGLRKGNLFRSITPMSGVETPFGNPFERPGDEDEGEQRRDDFLPPLDLLGRNIRAAVAYVEPLERGARFALIADLSRYH